MRAWQALVVVVLSLATSVARAETIEITGDWGGLLVAYEAKWAELAKRDVNVRVDGPCVSACTVLLGYIPRAKICATPKGAFGFHLAIPAFITPSLWKDYPPDIQTWITGKGGLGLTVMWLQAPEIYKFVHRC